MQVSKISALVLAITNKYSQEIVERWQFDVQIDGKPASGVASQEAATFQKGLPLTLYRLSILLSWPDAFNCSMTNPEISLRS